MATGDKIIIATQVDLEAGVNNATLPSGTIVSFPVNSVQAGYLECNGAAVSRTTYSDLYSAIGTVYGSGNGSTTFNVPDLRGQFIRGWDNSKGVDVGRSIASAQGDAIRNISGSITSIVRSQSGGTTATGAFTWASVGVDSDGGESRQGGNFYFSAANQVPTAAENRPVNIAMLYCIKV